MSDFEDVKQVIIMRKDLNMRKGKMCAQAAHASMKVLLELMTVDHVYDWRMADFEERKLKCWKLGPLSKWLNGSFTKICVSVSSELELEEIYNKALEKDIPVAMIVDAGKTEFNGVSTKTCCAIGPHWTTELNEITGKLALL